eukprot:scaffold178308_cov36-Tisochrysis_lutea.AAC.1
MPGPEMPRSGKASSHSMSIWFFIREALKLIKPMPNQANASATLMHHRGPARSTSSPYSTITPSAPKSETEVSVTKAESCFSQHLLSRNSSGRAAQEASSSAEQ